jgi:hypothetical protein
MMVQQNVVIDRRRSLGELDFISEDIAGNAYRRARAAAPPTPDPEAFAAAM